MRLDEKTLKVLNNFATINPSLLMREGNRINTMTLDKNCYADAVLEQEFPEDIPIYQLKEFLQTLKLFKDADIEVSEDSTQLHIKGERSSCSYNLADPSIIASPKRFLEYDESDVNFKLSGAELSQLLDAAGTLRLPNISFTNEGTTLVARAMDIKEPDGHDFKIELGDYDGDDFNSILMVDQMKIIPDSYECMIRFGKSICMKGSLIKYVFGLHKHSTPKLKA